MNEKLMSDEDLLQKFATPENLEIIKEELAKTELIEIKQRLDLMRKELGKQNSERKRQEIKQSKIPDFPNIDEGISIHDESEKILEKEDKEVKDVIIKTQTVKKPEGGIITEKPAPTFSPDNKKGDYDIFKEFLETDYKHNEEYRKSDAIKELESKLGRTFKIQQRGWHLDKPTRKKQHLIESTEPKKHGWYKNPFYVPE